MQYTALWLQHRLVILIIARAMTHRVRHVRQLYDSIYSSLVVSQLYVLELHAVCGLTRLLCRLYESGGPEHLSKLPSQVSA